MPFTLQPLQLRMKHRFIHMCYSKFDEIIDAIRALDADVISIETSRSHGDIIESFETAVYPLGIGLGVYDIHSRVYQLKKKWWLILKGLCVNYRQHNSGLNPDCGLKRDQEPETIAALKVLVAATKEVRQKLGN